MLKFECALCPASFRDLGDLWSHMAAHETQQQQQRLLAQSQERQRLERQARRLGIELQAKNTVN